MLSKFSVKKPYTVVVAVIVVLILGIMSFTKIDTDLLPSIDLPYAVVVTSYPGATPEEVEMMVTKPIEQSMATVSNIKNVSSESSENMSMVILEFYQSTNMDSATLEIRENLDMVSSIWQEDTIGSPMIMKLNPDMMPVMVASVDVKGMDSYELSSFVDETVLPSFEKLEGVASVTAMGLSQEKVKVTIDQNRIDIINDAIESSIDGDINKARAALNQARSQLNSASSQLQSEVNKNAAKLDEGEKQLGAAKTELDKADKEANKTLGDLQRKKADLANQRGELSTQKSSLQGQIKELEDAGQPVPPELSGQLDKINSGIAKVNDGISQVDSGINQATAGKDEITNKKSLLADKEKELAAGKATLDSKTAEAKAQIADGKGEIDAQSKSLESQAKTAKDQASIDDVITVDMISGILAAQNFSMPAGSMESEDSAYTVKVGDTLKSVDEIKKILLFQLDLADVDDVRLQDVADVSIIDSSENAYTKVNGNDGILLMFQKQSNYSTSEVSEKINAEMKILEGEHKDLSMTSFMDQGIYINMVTGSVIENLLFGGALAIFILFLFLRDFRPTLVVAVSIPASLLFAIVMMYFTGVTLNIISLSGLALGVGMLVDNSIVVIENIYRLRREGMPPLKAAVEGARQVSGAIIASTLTTICVFLPIVFTDGLSKELFMDMGLTISFSLIASLLVALSLVPSMAGRVLRKEYKDEGKFFLRFQSFYGKLLGWTLKHRAIVLITVVVLFFGSAYFAVAQGFSFMPQSDGTEMTATVTVEKEQSQEELWQISDDVIKAALAIPEVKAVGAMDSNSGSSMDMGMSSGKGKSTSVSFYLLLHENKTRNNQEIAKDLETATKDLKGELAITTSTMDMSMLGGSGIQLTVKGKDLDELANITKQLRTTLSSVVGIDEISDTMDDANPEIMISVNKDKAMEKGFTVAQVYAEVSAAIDTEKQATTLTMEGKDYPVIVLDRSAETLTADEIKDIPLKPVAQSETDKKGVADGDSSDSENNRSKDQQKNEDKEEDNEETVVGDVANIFEKQSPASISRNNQERYMTLNATVKEGYNIGLVGADVKEKLADYNAPPGYSVEMAGESVTIEKSITDLAKVILLALVLTYLIMVAQFQSLRSPFIVMFTVPLAFTGGFLALIITGLDVSVISLLGFLVLTGVVVNNGIVLVDYINRLQAGGMEHIEAIILGGKTRLRPILMTALTTILGLTTMALGVGMGAEMVQPMAVVCIGGLLYATILTLFVVPVIYDISRKKKKKTDTQGVEGDLDIFEITDADDIDEIKNR
ncbi:MAG: efflux RND transporter permease subunit [Clostridiales bacterium]